MYTFLNEVKFNLRMRIMLFSLSNNNTVFIENHNLWHFDCTQCSLFTSCCIQHIDRTLEMRSDAQQECKNLCYAIMYIVIWVNQKTESFEYHWLCALAMFDVKSFPAILSGIGHHFKFCRYINEHIDRTLEMTSKALTNAGKHITSDVANAHCQQHTSNWVFWLA